MWKSFAKIWCVSMTVVIIAFAVPELVAAVSIGGFAGLVTAKLCGMI